MWIPAKLFDLLGFSKEVLSDIKAELSAVRAERDLLKQQLTISQNSMEWIRLRINTLEAERTGLIEKAYNIKLPSPELVRTTPRTDPSWDPKNFSFEDVGDTLAKQMGLPVYGDHN